MLCSAEKWHIVSSLFQPDHEPVENGAHRRWLWKNSDHHPIREILAVLEGNSLNSLNRLIYPATPGTIFLFDSYEEHDRYYHPATNNVTLLWIFFLKHRMLARILQVNRGKISNARKELILVNSKIYDVVDEEWIRMKDSVLDADLKRRKILWLLSLLFLEMIEQDMAGDTAGSGDGNHQAQIIRAIHQHICSTSGKAMTVEKLARLAGYSKFHFFRLFKKYTGQNVHDCINASRMRKAKEMLKDGFLRKEISGELGFSCPSAFSNWYARKKDS